MSKPDLCSSCVNWLELQKDLITCDYDKFENVSKEKAELYVAQLFDCNEYEEIKD